MENENLNTQDTANSDLGAVSGSALSPFDFKKGNIFYDTKMKSIFTIYTFNNHGVRTRYPWGGSIFRYIALISPVKLTDELLLNFGFCNKVIDSKESILGYTKKYKGKYCDYFSDLYLQKNENYYFIEGFDFKFIYVHELQNFYYCLTGEMLSLS